MAKHNIPTDSDPTATEMPPPLTLSSDLPPKTRKPRTPRDPNARRALTFHATDTQRREILLAIALKQARTGKLAENGTEADADALALIASTWREQEADKIHDGDHVS